MQPIIWNGYEHSYFEKDKEWFYALAVTVACIALTFMVLGNFFFGLVIILGATCLALLQNTPPELHEFELSDKGLRIGTDIHSFDEMLAFWIDEEREEPTLLIDTKKFSLPNIVLPLGEVPAAPIRAFFTEKKIAEKKMQESFAHRAIEFFGL